MKMTEKPVSPPLSNVETSMNSGWGSDSQNGLIQGLLVRASHRVVVGPKPWASRPLARLLARAAVMTATAGLTMTSVYGAKEFVLTTASLAGLIASTQSEAHRATALPSDMLPFKKWDISGVSELSATSSVSPWSDIDTALLSDHVPTGLMQVDQPFMALAATLEEFSEKPYRDPGGLNVGYGYCITQRLADYGLSRVEDDLRSAGFSSEDVALLVSADTSRATREKQAAIVVSNADALRLLRISQPDYESIVRETLGDKTFESLPAHRQAALTWLAYNTGKEGFVQFKKLARAIRNDLPLEATRHLTPYYSENGRSVANARAGSVLMAAYWSQEGLKMAVEKTDVLLDAAQSGTSPLQAIDPKASWHRRMPPPTSPYVHTQVKTMLSERASLAHLMKQRSSRLDSEAPLRKNPRLYR